MKRLESLYESIAAYYDEIFPLKKTRLSFVSSLLNGEDLSLMDIGCATGSLALALSEIGHDVVGIDLDRDMVERAREKAKAVGVETEFQVKDMSELGTDFMPSSFDAVFCLGNTLVHLENPAKMEAFFRAVLTVLKDGGLFALQIVNYQRVLDNGITELPRIENDRLIFSREYVYEKETHRIRFHGSVRVKSSGVQQGSVEILYPLTFDELNAALANAGFSGKQFFGNENKSPYDKNSPALIAVAWK